MSKKRKMSKKIFVRICCLELCAESMAIYPIKKVIILRARSLVSVMQQMNAVQHLCSSLTFWATWIIRLCSNICAIYECKNTKKFWKQCSRQLDADKFILTFYAHISRGWHTVHIRTLCSQSWYIRIFPNDTTRFAAWRTRNHCQVSSREVTVHFTSASPA